MKIKGTVEIKTICMAGLVAVIMIPCILTWKAITGPTVKPVKMTKHIEKRYVRRKAIQGFGKFVKQSVKEIREAMK